MTIEFNKTVILKNGKECLLRPAKKGDGKELLDLFKKTHEESIDFLRTYPEENTLTEEDEEKFIENLLRSENETEILAIVDGKIVGSGGIEAIGTKIKDSHRAEIGISILKEYQSIGIGKALMNALILLSKELGYTQVELDVVAENEKAISLYKKCGFFEFGVNPRGFRKKDGAYQKLVLMNLELS